MQYSAPYFSIHSTLKAVPPRLPFKAVKDGVLGKRYALSLVFIGDIRSRRLNKTYRNINKPANVLSFPLSKYEGEIFINLHQARKDARRFERSANAFVGDLFIHGLLHLKGYGHGSTMEKRAAHIRRKHKLS